MRPLILNYAVERESIEQSIQYQYDTEKALNTVNVNGEIKDVVDIAHSYCLETLTKAQGERDDFSIQEYEMRRISETRGKRDEFHFQDIDFAIQTRTKGENDKLDYIY